MFTFINSLSFPLLCGILVVLMGACFFGAYTCNKKGNRAIAVLAVVIGISMIPTIIFRYSQEPAAPLVLKSIGSKILYLTLAVMIISVYIYALYRYRKERISAMEKQKLRITLIGLPVVFLFALIMVLILGI